MPTRLVHVVVDAADPAALARWWAEALGWAITVEEPDEVAVEPPGPDGVGVPLVFVPVADPKVTKNRVHLDLRSADADDQAALVARLTGLGARPADIGQGDVPWVVLADPEGNELCVLDPREEYAATGAVAAIVVDAADPAAQARFWAEAAGWPLAGSSATTAWLRAPSGTGPFVEFVRVDEPKRVKNRLHLDVAPHAGDDHAAEVARLRALGATPADVGQGEVTWVVLADPEGNELCVLSPREDWMRRVSEIDAGELVLRPVGREVAAALLEGRVPAGVVLAPGYPSRFSLETLQMVVDADGDGDGFGPYFMVRKADGAVVGEIGAGYHRATATAQVGYTVVEPSWGHGYATAALRALLAHLLADRRVRRVVAETLEEHTASRRVMEKAGMRYHHARTGEVDGTTVALVVYEARPAEALPADG